jgi:hypothetical protein
MRARPTPSRATPRRPDKRPRQHDTNPSIRTGEGSEAHAEPCHLTIDNSPQAIRRGRKRTSQRRQQSTQQRPMARASSRCRGRLHALDENLRICLSSRAPSEAGRSPHHSRAINRGPQSYHPDPTRQAKTPTDTSDPGTPAASAPRLSPRAQAARTTSAKPPSHLSRQRHGHAPGRDPQCGERVTLRSSATFRVTGEGSAPGA